MAEAQLMAPGLLEIIKALIDKTKNEGRAPPPIDPAEIAKCVTEVMTKFLETKVSYIKVVSEKITLDQELLLDNLRKLSNGMKVRVEERRIILNIPVGKREYDYQFKW